MTPVALQRLPQRDTLLAVGLCLAFVGIVLRGIARTQRRDQARRDQHRRDERRSGESDLALDLDQSAGWLERNIGKSANLALLTGAMITLIALWR